MGKSVEWRAPGSAPRYVPALGDRRLAGLLLALALASVAAGVLLGAGREGGIRPGDLPGHLLGIAGSALMVAGLAYPLVKRTPAGASLTPWWHQGHLLLGASGAAMVAIHTSGRLGKAPGLLALAVLGLLALGIYGRLVSNRTVHHSFASDPRAFLPAVPYPAALAPLIARKRALATLLEPGAVEASFGLTLRHWVRKPVLAFRYSLLAMEEERVVGTQRSLPPAVVVWLQRNWRLFHILMVGLMGLGLLAHVVTVLFFAGYAAEGGEPYWWYLRR